MAEYELWEELKDKKNLGGLLFFTLITKMDVVGLTSIVKKQRLSLK